MARLEGHLRKVKRVARNVDTTLGVAATIVDDLKKQQAEIGSHIAENNSIIGELNAVNVGLKAQYESLGKTVKGLEASLNGR